MSCLAEMTSTCTLQEFTAQQSAVAASCFLMFASLSTIACAANFQCIGADLSLQRTGNHWAKAFPPVITAIDDMLVCVMRTSHEAPRHATSVHGELDIAAATAHAAAHESVEHLKWIPLHCHTCISFLMPCRLMLGILGATGHFVNPWPCAGSPIDTLMCTLIAAFPSTAKLCIQS